MFRLQQGTLKHRQQLHILTASAEAELDLAFKAMVQMRVRALLIGAVPLRRSVRKLVTAALALALVFPAVDANAKSKAQQMSKKARKYWWADANARERRSCCVNCPFLLQPSPIIG